MKVGRVLTVAMDRMLNLDLVAFERGFKRRGIDPGASQPKVWST